MSDEYGDCPCRDCTRIPDRPVPSLCAPCREFGCNADGAHECLVPEDSGRPCERCGKRGQVFVLNDPGGISSRELCVDCLGVEQEQIEGLLSGERDGEAS